MQEGWGETKGKPKHPEELCRVLLDKSYQVHRCVCVYGTLYKSKQGDVGWRSLESFRRCKGNNHNIDTENGGKRACLPLLLRFVFPRGAY